MTKDQIIYSGPIVKRSDAKAEGLEYYFTGKPCKRGHIDQRKTKQCGCLSCDKDYYEENRQKIIDRACTWQKDNLDKRSEYMSNYWRSNIDDLKAYHKDRYDSDPDAHREYSREYHHENRDVIIPKMRIRYEGNKDEHAARAKIWRDANPELVRVSKSNRKAAMRNAEGTHTADDISTIMEAQNGLCVYCATDLSDGYHVDHVMPLILGGSNWPENLQCLCPTCNLRKGGKHPNDWHKEIGFLG